MTETANVIEIENEYKRIDGRWLRLHFNTSIFLVVFAISMECIMGIVLYNMGEIKIPLNIYLIKYLIAPLLINLFFVFIGYLIVESTKLSQTFKIYAVSLQLTIICFVFFSVHCIFNALYLIFTIPILFTIVYGQYTLTTATALCSIFAEVASELFINWDPDKINVLENNLELANFIISFGVLFSFYMACMIVIRFEKEKNAASIKKELERHLLKQKLQNDELTAINNRTALRRAFQNMEDDASQNTYIFVMIDIDNFKMLNDTLGHAKGDLFLMQFGSVLKVNCVGAVPFRFGGDEFCILFKNATTKEAVATCEKIQKDFKEVLAVNKIDLPLTASFGIAHYDSGMTSADLLKNADAALYYSKTVKNAIRVYCEGT